MTDSEPAAKGADEILRRAIMIGEVPRGEAGVVIGEHLLDGARRVDMAVDARDLPHAVQDAANAEICGELEPTRCEQRHVDLRTTRHLRPAAPLVSACLTPTEPKISALWRPKFGAALSAVLALVTAARMQTTDRP